MAGWIKRPPRSPKSLGWSHLDSVIEPRDYQQDRSAAAQRSLGYPWEGLAGRLEVREWSPGNLIAVYITWSGGIAKRAFYNGKWREWRDAMGQVID